MCLIWNIFPGIAQDTTGIWMKYEHPFISSYPYDNPLYDVKEFAITFTAPSGKKSKINGFWDGGTNWKVRFMPNERGSWTFTTYCSDTSNTGLHRVSGEFLCVPNDSGYPIYDHGSIGQPEGTYHLAHADGTPFFWTGCTSWNGPLRSTEEEWDTYLKDRSKKTFSVILFVSTQWRGGAENRLGQLAFTGAGRISINTEFFQYLDMKIDRINDYGMVAAPVLLWALQFGEGRELSPGYYLPRNEAILLARYMVARYGGNHVAWILGGDGRYVDEYEQRWKNIGRGVFGEDHPGIVALHPHGLSWIGNDYIGEDWLDVVGYQSSHSTGERTVNWINTGPPAEEWSRIPPKAIMNMEPIYEQILEDMTTTDVRKAMYWSLFATPVSGITYGANGIWPWLRKGEQLLNHRNTPWTETWHESLDLPGSLQTGYLSELIRKFEWWNFRPAHEELQVHQPGEDRFDHFIAMVRSLDHKIILGYVPVQSTFEIFNPELKTYQLQWFNPQTNEYSNPKIPGSGSSYRLKLTSPGTGDRVFILREQ